MGGSSVLSSSGPTRIATREMNEDDYSTENTTGKRMIQGQEVPAALFFFLIFNVNLVVCILHMPIPEFW